MAVRSPVSELPLGAIAALCEKYGVEELSVFGSILRHDFTPESDVDFLVVFKADDYGPWACKLTELAEDLSALLGRRADLVSKRAVEQSENYIRRKHILNSMKPIYVA